MDKQDKQGPGLHKEVSTIFDGVPLPLGRRLSSDGPVDQGPPGTGSSRTAQAVAGMEPRSTGASGAPETRAYNEPTRRGVVKPLNTRTDFFNNILAKVLPSDLDDSVVRRQKIMALLIPVLAVILVLVFVKMLGKPTRSDASVGQKTEKTTQSESEKKSKKGVDWELPEVISKPARDPMKSEAVAPTDGGSKTDKPEKSSKDATATGADEQSSAELPDLEVTGILYSEEKPAAIVGTAIVHEGDTVQGVVVAKINKDSIELELNGRRWEQGLRQ